MFVILLIFSLCHQLKQISNKIAAFSLGKGLVLGASGLGLGALCFYGLGFASEPGAIDRSV